jgi:hypothetical protein
LAGFSKESRCPSDRHSDKEPPRERCRAGPVDKLSCVFNAFKS